MQKRCQASTELIVIFAIALAILLTVLILNQQTFTATYSQYQTAKAKNVVNDLADAAERLYQQGTGAKTRVYLVIPNDVQFTSAANRTLLINMYAGERNTDIYRSLNFNISGTIPVEEGNYWVTLQARENDVLIGTEKDTPDAHFLAFDLSDAIIRPGNRKRLEDVKINISNRDLVLIAVVVTWTSNDGEAIKRVRFGGGSEQLWKDKCNWGCSPTGKQPSGTLLDFGTRDYAAAAGNTKTIDRFDFDSSMSGKTFNITFTLQDGSTKSSGLFTPPDG